MDLVIARTFTKSDAQDLIPLLEALFGETRGLVEELLARRARKSSAHDEDSRFRIQQLTALIQSRLQLVTAMGLEVRRVDGLVDIPAVRDGELGYYCWRFGQTEIADWHPVYEDCCADRDAAPPAAAAYA